MKNILLLSFILILVMTGCSEDKIEPVLKGNLTGKVISKSSGEPLENVKISTSPASSTVFTDSLGIFILSNITVDTYAVQAEMEGFITGFESVTILEQETANVAFELTVSLVNNRPPTRPELLFPEDGATQVPLEVLLAWDSIDPNNDDLNFDIALRNGTTNEMFHYEVEQDTTLLVSNLQLATNYFWQVTVSDGINDPVSSEISVFTTLTNPDNPYLFVRVQNGNNVIFSGNELPSTEDNPDINVLQLTSSELNSFRPKRNNIIHKIAFLRTVGSDTHLFTMNNDGSNIQQITAVIPVTGFRQDELDFTWAQNGSRIYYPHLDKVFSINNDGSGLQMIYQTADGSLVSEIDTAEFDNDILLLKTNDFSGYNVRIFTYRLSAVSEETVILENVPGAAGGINLSANADKVLYSRDVSNSENINYRLFQSRIFIFDMNTLNSTLVNTFVVPGENELDASFSPTEGGIIFTRVNNNLHAQPRIYSRIFNQTVNDILLFTDSFMPNWE